MKVKFHQESSHKTVTFCFSHWSVNSFVLFLQWKCKSKMKATFYHHCQGQDVSGNHRREACCCTHVLFSGFPQASLLGTVKTKYRDRWGHWPDSTGCSNRESCTECIQCNRAWAKVNVNPWPLWAGFFRHRHPPLIHSLGPLKNIIILSENNRTI